MILDDLPQLSLLSALDMARLVYFDGRLHETASVIAEAARKNVPILIDSERKREGLGDLLSTADCAVCSAKFPQVAFSRSGICVFLSFEIGTNRGTINSKCSCFHAFAIAETQICNCDPGRRWLYNLERNENAGESKLEEMDVDRLLDFLKQKKDDGVGIPMCVSSPFLELRAKDIGTASGRLSVGTAEKIPQSKLNDTTGAGEAFIGAVLYAICAGMPPDKMLPFASKVVTQQLPAVKL